MKQLSIINFFCIAIGRKGKRKKKGKKNRKKEKNERKKEKREKKISLKLLKQIPFVHTVMIHFSCPAMTRGMEKKEIKFCDIGISPRLWKLISFEVNGRSSLSHIRIQCERWKNRILVSSISKLESTLERVWTYFDIFFTKKKTCMHFVIGDKRDKYKKKKNIVTRRGKIQAYRLLANE